MSDTSYTQGDWVFYDPDVQRPLTARGNPSDKRIMVLHPDGHRLLANCSEGFTNNRGTIGHEERKANARLMAAAPKLLQALYGAMRTLVTMHGKDCKCGECRAARSAIEDATGLDANGEIQKATGSPDI